MHPANAISSLPRKIGVAIVTSGKCPEHNQGSFEIMTSPGLSVSGGKISRNFFSDIGMVPINEGMLRVDCARDLPLASSRMQAKSLDSLNTVEKEARTNAADASSTMATRRFHKISRLMGSNSSDISAPLSASNRQDGYNSMIRFPCTSI